ncbi:hypothetical protein [Delftia acidovorans]|uniref:Uncharacterized protein n=1 Tax=Delftia acidovorans TaxID=80866 RepID=A0AAJ2RA95_DELAC|nr:hypothetical protein [Delftia acidovorans]MDX4958113.1 hypothetical protein [Delftia acidovorans]
MKKDRAIELLGGTPKKAAEAMGYRAVQTIYLWPDVLPQATADRVMGVVGRMSKPGKRRRRAQPTTQEHGHA